MNSFFNRFSHFNILFVSLCVAIGTMFASIMLASLGAPRWVGGIVIGIAVLNILFNIYVAVFKLGKR